MSSTTITDDTSPEVQLLMELLKYTSSINSAEYSCNGIVTSIQSYLQCEFVGIRKRQNGRIPFLVRTDKCISSESFENSIIYNDSLYVSPMEMICQACIDNNCHILKGLINSQSQIVLKDINQWVQNNSENLISLDLIKTVEYSSVLIQPLFFNDEIIGFLQCMSGAASGISSEKCSICSTIAESLGDYLGSLHEMSQLKRGVSLFKSAQTAGKMGSWAINKSNGVFTYVQNIDMIHRYPFKAYKTTLQEFLVERVLKEDCLKIKNQMNEIIDGDSFHVDFRAYYDPDDLRYYRAVGKMSNGIVQGITLDFSEQKQIQLKAEENKAFLESIVNGMNTSIILMDPQRNVVIETNEYAQQLFDMSDEELKQIRGTTLLSVRYFKKPKALKVMSEDMQSNEEGLLKRRDDSVVPVQRIIMKSMLQNKMHYVIIFFDITQHKQLEQQLAHSQKMESIGSLAAGVAHELNTPIQYIGDNMHFLKESFSVFQDIVGQYQMMIECVEKCGKCDADVKRIREIEEDGDLDFLLEEIPEALRQSIDGIERVSTIVQAMKKFSHPGQTEMSLHNLNEIIKNTVIVARNEWKYVAELETDFNPALPEIPVHGDDISQVILNMIVNASHAIGDMVEDGQKGKITITTSYDEEYVILSISDTGAGIPPEIYEKIFDPFFTTKEVGKGTGQGLSMAYSIITEKHNGKLEFQSELGAGTTFIIKLPRG